jgi:hypothetical protein
VLSRIVRTSIATEVAEQFPLRDNVVIWVNCKHLDSFPEIKSHSTSKSLHHPGDCRLWFENKLVQKQSYLKKKQL